MLSVNMLFWQAWSMYSAVRGYTDQPYPEKGDFGLSDLTVFPVCHLSSTLWRSDHLRFRMCNTAMASFTQLICSAIRGKGDLVLSAKS